MHSQNALLQIKMFQIQFSLVIDSEKVTPKPDNFFDMMTTESRLEGPLNVDN